MKKIYFRIGAFILIAATAGCSVINDNPGKEGFSSLTLDYLITDLRPDIAPTLGEQKVLVCPIALGGSATYSWTDINLSKIDNYIYGNKEDTPDQWNSLVSYFDNASNGKLHVSGERAPLYHAASKYTESYFNSSSADMNYSRLFDMFAECVTWLGENGVDLDSYDSNDDGYIDSIHFVVNGSDNNSNASALWPHMYNTGIAKGSKAKPTANVYSLSNLGHYSSARTTIHEQGHIYGLEDYYDYSYSGADYIGGADMQSYNMFDWNSFSKLVVGWANPYYFDGTKDEATIEINAAGTSNDCLIIPTSSWNGTQFDEYMLLELFSPVGNNESDWDSWVMKLYKPGVRIYHVDARVWGFNSYDNVNAGSLVSDFSTSNYNYYCMANTNSYNDRDYENPVTLSEFSASHLLHLMQADGADSFSNTSGGYETYLNTYDLFRAGDTFSMSKFGATFFPKKTTMNNGDSFPYEITIQSVSKDKATIKVSKI